MAYWLDKLVKKSLWGVQPYVPGKPIEEVQRELGLKQIVKLASNESPYGPSLKVLKAMAAAARNINRYPVSDCYALRQALSRKLRVQSGQLLFGNGSDELIVLTIRAFVRPHEEVIIAQPSFLIYELAARVAGVRVKAVSLKDFFYDLPGMRKAITPKTKIIFIGNPDNPAGTYISQDRLHQFLKAIRPHLIVFLDEAYFEFVDRPDYPHSLKLLKKFPNLIVTRTFSKMYGLAGLRIGYAIAHPKLIDYLNRVREPFNVNALAQAAALACLRDGRYYRDVARRIRKQREFLYACLEGMGVPFHKTVTNFILIQVKRDAGEVTQKLLQRGVIVRDMRQWGLKQYIRVTIGTERENRKFIKELKNILTLGR